MRFAGPRTMSRRDPASDIVRKASAIMPSPRYRSSRRLLGSTTFGFTAGGDGSLTPSGISVTSP